MELEVIYKNLKESTPSSIFTLGNHRDLIEWIEYNVECNVEYTSHGPELGKQNALARSMAAI